MKNEYSSACKCFFFNLQSQLNVFFLYKNGIMPLLIQLLNVEIE